MCLLAAHYRVVPEAPVVVAANREERFDRPASPPHLQPGHPGILCGVDQQAGGTWLGVNEHGLLVAATNRSKSSPPPAPRSRGLLCRDLLGCHSAADAARRAIAALATGRYAGANYLCLDAAAATVVYGGDRLRAVELEPGLHLMTNGDMDDSADDRQNLARRLLESKPPSSARELIAASGRVCAHPEIVIRGPDRGTVSSQLVALTVDPQAAVYLHAPGPPGERSYDDHSASLRRLLAAGGDRAG
ncbi:MAG: NRDE family protein [Planctomycetota bacterium]|jgi:uncharacterized protein with NRDE domain